MFRALFAKSRNCDEIHIHSNISAIFAIAAEKSYLPLRKGKKIFVGEAYRS